MGKYKAFREALLFGQEAQERVVNILQHGGAFVNRKEGRERQDCELHFNNHTFRLEVKNEDHYAGKGNICIETRQGWPLRPSGIATSEATIAIHTFKDDCALYRVREMREWLKEEQAAGRRFEQAFRKSDNNNKGFVLELKRMYLQPWFDYRPINTLAESILWTY